MVFNGTDIEITFAPNTDELEHEVVKGRMREE